MGDLKYYHWRCLTCGAAMRSIREQNVKDFAYEHLYKTRIVTGHWFWKKESYHDGEFYTAGPEVGLWFQERSKYGRL